MDFLGFISILSTSLFIKAFKSFFRNYWRKTYSLQVIYIRMTQDYHKIIQIETKANTAGIRLEITIIFILVKFYLLFCLIPFQLQLFNFLILFVDLIYKLYFFCSFPGRWLPGFRMSARRYRRAGQLNLTLPDGYVVRLVMYFILNSFKYFNLFVVVVIIFIQKLYFVYMLMFGGFFFHIFVQ